MFDIEPITLVISLVLFAAFCAPFVYHISKQRKTTRQQHARFALLAKDAHISPDAVDFWRNKYALGLDERQRQLLYVKFGEEETVHLLDLGYPFELKSYKLSDSNLAEKGPVPDKFMDRMGFQISLRAPIPKNYTLEFYNSALFSDQMGEIVLMRKWEEILRGVAKNKNLVKS
ncbi:hypothetical protein C943_04438 [Mariniradius saccharolyticus AK6]|uniref:Uncharacterized protein n=1 Tax=Mariniradius saccharolyticus AK6 TaxID=1239962 RepID=M7X828_9BACT|nr:hypothetical protein [Mariniradius saccharolyticus]EMS33560.1 hypothetical protein C943_04438 [Mariniradius saccharolyticus AK6]